nr:hypothetical protein B0A51_10048 [Rachicladosporium sp. CCFEE 5018]
MHLFLPALTSLLALTTSAYPNTNLESRTLSTCMSDSEATSVANNFATLITSYSKALADKVLASGFTDYSDSVIELINSGCSGPVALGTETFTSRSAFEAAQSSQPAIPFQILNQWLACDHVTVRWRSALTPQQVTGILVIGVTKNGTRNPDPKWLISEVYSEFNSGAWLVDLGVFKPTCS